MVRAVMSTWQRLHFRLGLPGRHWNRLQWNGFIWTTIFRLPRRSGSWDTGRC
ncbi:3 beta-hydroxysteroid dehydrogenase/Delta 5--_4-isomerase domain protein [Mycobacterium xenopi 4042]|uniref:3 beta-hydroxysteroid dehydrogenase/Delta 5-->4-isomerase domain protein n=1 Tax=Mycobacterium xenopi 4042 TaxID=1299334 RepID=X8ANY3_MYCXE|nr:3 beta-hydroxysteroid dehydrogenase/Delta 5-->4-isomerase domain protein [Mycobacterium xenopi 4042]